MAGVPRYDRFLLVNKIGRDRVLRRYFTAEERWCWVAGVLGTAADAPVRGWLLLTEKVAADTEDIADAAGVEVQVAAATIEKAHKYGMVEHDAQVGCDWVPDWEMYNPPAAKRYDPTSARRQALFRDPELREQVRARDGDNCRYCGHEVIWTDRRSPLGGTYDHLDPYGENSIENLVVACRGCNSQKGRRTPEEAGMELLTPRFNSRSKSQPKSGVTQGSKERSKEGTTTAKAVENDDRPEVAELCSLLADEIEGNGSKRPAITKAWRDACRLMLDNDGRGHEEIRRAILWCQADDFWRANVLSMPKLREKFDQMRLQAERQRPRLHAVGDSAEARRLERQRRRMAIANGTEAVA